MRLIFMGTPDFSVPALRALIEAGHEIACVYTRAPKPAGRGQKETPSPVHRAAQEAGLAVRTPRTLRDAAEQAAFAALNADAAVVVAYGLILPVPVLEAPRLGCVNIHASLLPRWRGAAPIQRAIEAGDRETGVTIMGMEAGLDTGPMLLAEATPIGPEDTAATLHDRLAEIGARLILPALQGLASDALRPVPQPEAGVTYAAKIDKAEARLDWTLPAEQIARKINAFSPFPGAWCELGGERLKLLRAVRAEAEKPSSPGAALDGALTIACGSGAVRILAVQRPGKGPVEAEAFLRGHAVPPGTLLE
jgi:methionyl-tRNA formyltransferase